MFSISGLKLYFPALEPWVVRSVAQSTSCSLPASCSFAHPAPQSTTLLDPPAGALLRVLSARLPISAPPTGLDECFFFNSMVVGLPYSSIFCQLWLFFVVKLLLSFFGCARRHSMSTYAAILAGSPRNSISYMETTTFMILFIFTVFRTVRRARPCDAPRF